MKKLLLFITVLFFGISTINAQDASYGYEAGDWVLGGGVHSVLWTWVVLKLK